MHEYLMDRQFIDSNWTNEMVSFWIQKDEIWSFPSHLLICKVIIDTHFVVNENVWNEGKYSSGSFDV